MWNVSGQGADNDTGGFIKSPSQSQRTPTPGNAAKRWARPPKNIFPVTVSDLVAENFVHDSFTILDQTMSMVQLIAIVRSVERHSDRNIYMVDDYTGPLFKVIQWMIDVDDDEYAKHTMVVNTYICVIGGIRNMNGELHIIHYDIRPVTNYVEVIYHMLKVMHTKKRLLSLQNAPMDIDDGFNASTSHGPANLERFKGMSNLQQKVFQIIQDNDCEQGCPIRIIVQNLKNVAMGELRNTLTFMHNEGHIYSTIDEDHFKATE